MITGMNLTFVDDKLQNLVPTSSDEFAVIDDEKWKEGLIGQPEVLIQDDPARHFKHHEIIVEVLKADPIATIQPLQTAHEWIALLKSGKIVHLNLETVDLQPLAHLPQIPDDPLLRVSLDGNFCSVTESHGRTGTVLNLKTGQVTMQLDRGPYSHEHTTFPVAMFEHEGKSYIIHGTGWNRLDISDPASGELLTQREYEKVEKGKRPRHYLDYFHGCLFMSPDQRHVIDDGWVWHPIGIIRCWDVMKWLTNNVWESEDGDSVKHVISRLYYWDGPLYWLDNQRIAVWGFGDDDEWLIPAVTIFDATTGSRVNWFPGVQKGELYFDTFLFSVGEHSTEVWNIETEARINVTENFSPTAYHLTSREFLTVGHNGVLHLSRFTKQ